MLLLFLSARNAAPIVSKARSALARHGFLVDRGTWIEPGILACAYPKRDEALIALADQGITRLINLTEAPHDPARLSRHGLTEVHIPVRDFTSPSPDQIDRGLAAIRDALAAGDRIAVQCGGGLGRTGTLVACYLVDRGLSADDAIRRVRDARPGSIETKGQEAAVRAHAARRATASGPG